MEQNKKVFTWEQFWINANILVDLRKENYEALFTERNENGELIQLPKAKEFVDKINKLIENDK